MKYRKKPVVIEAIQLTETNGKEVCEFMGTDISNVDWDEKDSCCKDDAFPYSALYIKTLEGDKKASIGDYIIKGVNGEFYPCKPDIFYATYDALGESYIDDDH